MTTRVCRSHDSGERTEMSRSFIYSDHEHILYKHLPPKPTTDV